MTVLRGFAGGWRRGFCLLAALTISCDRDSSTPAAVPKKVYEARGIVRSLEPDGKTVVIQHQAVSNYMGAMTMPFEVHDTNELKSLQPGDTIAFHLVVTTNEGWVENIRRLGGNVPAASSAPAGMPVARAGAPLDVGKTLPDFQFTNELGQPVHLADYRGRVIAFTFFFTSCPFPNFCPRLADEFSATDALLRQNIPKHWWHFFSITFDPAADTPSRLKEYAGRWHYDPASWSFLTGQTNEIQRLADLFDERYWAEGGSISHNLRTVVIDAGGKVNTIFQGNNWSPAELAAAMQKARAGTGGELKAGK